MKNGKHYYDLLTNEEKVLFDKNTTQYSIDKSFKKKYHSFYDYMSSQFVWYDSNEGHEYWNNIATSNRE